MGFYKCLYRVHLFILRTHCGRERLNMISDISQLLRSQFKIPCTVIYIEHCTLGSYIAELEAIAVK